MKIHEFDPQIYPVKLWVSFGKDCKALSERFSWKYDDTDIDIDWENSDAVTGLVQAKSDRKIGVLIAFESKKHCHVGNIAHESSHAVDDIWQRLGEKNVGHEANAYLMGWIASCITKAKNYKL